MLGCFLLHGMKQLMRGWISGTLAGVGITMLVVTLVPGFLNSNISDNPWLPVSQFVFFTISSIGTTFLLRKFVVAKVPDTKSFATTISWVLISLLVISYLVLRHAKDYQISLSILVSMTVVVIGWWVQSILSAKASRRQHTLNTILNTRSSDIYQRHLANYAKLIKEHQHIHPKMASWFHKGYDDEFEGASIPQSLRDAINGINYVMNYFEFLALAIRQGDLDESLLKECFCGMLPKIERRAFYLIREAQQKDERFFEAFVNMVRDWSKDNKSLVLSHKSNPSDADLGVPFPTDEQVNKILAGQKVNLRLNCYDDKVTGIHEKHEARDEPEGVEKKNSTEIKD